MKTLNIAILTSRSCEDGLALLQEIKAGKLDAEVKIILSNKKKINPPELVMMCQAEGIPIYFKTSSSRIEEQDDQEFITKLEEYDIDLILLIGYMRILTPAFIERYRGRIMNIHPSVIPAFAGGMDKDVHNAVLDLGAKLTGCTLHFVDEYLDAGPIILQEPVRVAEDETVESLRKKVQATEQEIILEGVKLFQAGRLKIEGRKVRILPVSEAKS